MMRFRAVNIVPNNSVQHTKDSAATDLLRDRRQRQYENAHGLGPREQPHELRIEMQAQPRKFDTEQEPTDQDEDVCSREILGPVNASRGRRVAVPNPGPARREEGA
jgi:hypothetical protein